MNGKVKYIGEGSSFDIALHDGMITAKYDEFVTLPLQTCRELIEQASFIPDEDTKMMLRSCGDYTNNEIIDGLWSGKRCFIIGSGHSLKGFDFSALDKELTIAVNHSIMFYPKASAVIFLDKCFLDKNGSEAREVLKEYNGMIFCCQRTGYQAEDFRDNVFPYYTIPEQLVERTIVSSDDEYILKRSKEYNFVQHKRDPKLSDDHISMKYVLLSLIDDFSIHENEIIIMLYLTYPQRTWSDIEKACVYFKENNAQSLLCRKEWKGTHPCLCMIDKCQQGKQFAKHDLYRRQDYPEVFELSHYIFIAYAGEIFRLNSNLYNGDTIFFPINDLIDIDTEKDYMRFANENSISDAA